MLLHDGIHVAQSQAEAFHVVYVSCGHTIQLIKNLAQMFLGDSDAIVGERHVQPTGVIPGPHREARLVPPILDGVVHQVEDHIHEVGPVALDDGVCRLQLAGRRTALLPDVDGVVPQHGLHEVVEVHRLAVQLQFALVEHGRAQHVLHQLTEPLVF